MSNLKLQVYKCPSCGGAVRFDANAGQLTCSWCANEYEAADLLVRESVTALQGYQCPECGAGLMHDDFIAADTCPYCGNNEIAPHRFEGEFEPDYIIPFTVTKTRAIELYENELAKKRFLPDDYETEARIISAQGTYVPFWLQEGVVDFDFTYYCNDGGGSKNRAYSYHHRAGTYSFTRVPADGSARMPDDMMDSIEPYDYNALAPFSLECLPGFVAERYTVEQDEVNSRVDGRVKNSAWLAGSTTIPARWKNKYAEKDRSRAVVEHGKSEQALLPVWLFVVQYRGEKYLVGVNGQTGKVAMNLPVDKGKMAKYARKQALSSEAMAIGAILFPLVIVFVVMVFTDGPSVIPLIPGKALEWLQDIATNFYSDDLSAKLQVIGAILLALGVLIAAPLFGYGYGKRAATQSMQNVEEAVNANAYDVGGLAITLSETGKGPRQEHDNWPA